MSRISSLIVASTLAILPISAFAQQTAAPAKIAGPTSLTTAVPVSEKTVNDKTVSDKTVTGAPVAGTPVAGKAVTATPATTTPATGVPATGTTVMDKAATAPMSTAPASTAQSTQPPKSDAKTTGHGAKSDVHGMNGVTAPHAKTGVPAKTTEPAKS